MRILLFGGSGRLGTAMRKAWNDKHQIIAPEQEEVAWTKEGMRQWLSAAQPEFLINTTAYNNVDGAEGEGRAQAFWLNGELPGVMAELAKEFQIPFLHFSSDYVFAGDKRDGYVENDEVHPMSVYGESKVAGEHNVLAKYPEGSYIVRTSRLYGEPATGADAKKSFIEIIVEELKTKPAFEVNDFELSAPTSIMELVSHLEKYILLARPEPGIYHMSNEGGATWMDWAVEIRDQLGMHNKLSPRDVVAAVRPAKRPPFSVLRSTKLPSMLPWRDALRNYLNVWPH